MKQKVKNVGYVLAELTGIEKQWPVGLVLLLPIFTMMTILGFTDSELELEFMVAGINIMPIHYIIPYLVLVPVKYILKICHNDYGTDITKKLAKKIFLGASAEMTGYILAIGFALIAFMAPAITNENFYWFIIIGGATIIPCYNILSKYHTGESVIVNYFASFFKEEQSIGAPFK